MRTKSSTSSNVSKQAMATWLPMVPARASGVNAVEVGAVIGVAQLIKGHHVRPDLVYVSALAEIQHVRREAAGRAHIDLQGYDVSPLAKALLALRQLEELQVEEAAGGAKGLQRGLARRLHIGGDLLVHIIVSRHALVHHVHDGVAGDVAGGEQHLAAGVAHAVVGGDHTGDVFLHQVGHRRQLAEKGHGVLVTLQLPGGDSAHTVVRLHNDGIAHLMGKGQGAWEDLLLAGTRRLDEVLRRKGIRAWVDCWGPDVNHDWPWWKKQIRYFLPNVVGQP